MPDRMNDYELVYILVPTLGEDEIPVQMDRVSKFVTDRGGEVVKSTQWGPRRRLAYQIGKHRDGIYVTSEFRGPASAIADLERVLRLNDDVIRHVVVRKPAPKAPKLPRRLRRARQAGGPAPAPIAAEPVAETTPAS